MVSADLKVRAIPHSPAIFGRACFGQGRLKPFGMIDTIQIAAD